MTPLETVRDPTCTTDHAPSSAETAGLAGGVCRLTNLLEALVRQHREMHHDADAVPPMVDVGPLSEQVASAPRE